MSISEHEKPVDIDQGTFKYVLIRVTDKKNGKVTFLVRGNCHADFHADIAEPIEAALVARGLKVDIPGGGRIRHDPVARKITVYGYSVGYGRADHELTCTILRNFYDSSYEIIHDSNPELY